MGGLGLRQGEKALSSHQDCKWSPQWVSNFGLRLLFPASASQHCKNPWSDCFPLPLRTFAFAPRNACGSARKLSECPAPGRPRSSDSTPFRGAFGCPRARKRKRQQKPMAAGHVGRFGGAESRICMGNPEGNQILSCVGFRV